MKYNVLKSDAPTLPHLGKGTECISLLLTQVSKDMRNPILPPISLSLPLTQANANLWFRRGWIKL